MSSNMRARCDIAGAPMLLQELFDDAKIDTISEPPLVRGALLVVVTDPSNGSRLK